MDIPRARSSTLQLFLDCVQEVGYRRGGTEAGPRVPAADGGHGANPAQNDNPGLSDPGDRATPCKIRAPRTPLPGPAASLRLGRFYNDHAHESQLTTTIA